MGTPLGILVHKSKLWCMPSWSYIETCWKPRLRSLISPHIWRVSSHFQSCLFVWIRSLLQPDNKPKFPMEQHRRYWVWKFCHQFYLLKLAKIQLKCPVNDTISIPGSRFQCLDFYSKAEQYCPEIKWKTVILLSLEKYFVNTIYTVIHV